MGVAAEGEWEGKSYLGAGISVSVALLAPLKPFSSGMVHANESSLQQHIQLKLLQTKKDIDATAKRIEEMTNDFPAGTNALQQVLEQLKRKHTEMEQALSRMRTNSYRISRNDEQSRDVRNGHQPYGEETEPLIH